jgi:hypothetical protein
MFYYTQYLFTRLVNYYPSFYPKSPLFLQNAWVVVYNLLISIFQYLQTLSKYLRKPYFRHFWSISEIWDRRNRSMFILIDYYLFMMLDSWIIRSVCRYVCVVLTTDPMYLNSNMLFRFVITLVRMFAPPVIITRINPCDTFQGILLYHQDPPILDSTHNPIIRSIRHHSLHLSISCILTHHFSDFSILDTITHESRFDPYNHTLIRSVSLTSTVPMYLMLTCHQYPHDDNPSSYLRDTWYPISCFHELHPLKHLKVIFHSSILLVDT